MTKFKRYLAYGVSAASVVAGILWFTTEPGYEPFITLLGLLPGAWAYRVESAKSSGGKGGNAITAGKDADIELDNTGIFAAGKGGKGGPGGDAIHVADGVQIKIINRGTIQGGDAGQ